MSESKYKVGQHVYFFYDGTYDSRHSSGVVREVRDYGRDVFLYDIEDLEHKNMHGIGIFEHHIYATELELYQSLESRLERKINLLDSWLLNVKEYIKGLKEENSDSK